MALKTIIRNLAVILLGSLIYLPANAAGQEADDQANPEVIVVPFDPPLGEVLRYDVATQRQRSRGDTSLSYQQELIFDRFASGYVLKIETKGLTSSEGSFDPGNPGIRASLPAALQPFLLPQSIELDEYGEMVRIHDWENWRAQIEALPEFLAETVEQADREAALEVARKVVQPLQAMSAEQAPAVMSKAWYSILGFGGMELEEGELYEADIELPPTILPVAIPATMELYLTRDDAGRLSYTQVSRPERERMAEVLGQFMENLVPDQAKQELEKLEALEMEERLELVMDSVSGLPWQATISRTASIGDEARSFEQTTITRVE